jgi:hypothetical protein
MHVEAELAGLLALIDQVAANISSMSAASRGAKRTAAHFSAREKQPGTGSIRWEEQQNITYER